MKIAKANDEQYQSVRSFYHSLIDAMKGSHYDIGWEKDIYPAPEFLKESIDAGELYMHRGWSYCRGNGTESSV